MDTSMNPASTVGKEKTLDSTSSSFQSGYQPPIVLVKKIPTTLTEDNLVQLLGQFGNIKEVRILQAKSYAYVEFTSLNDALGCVDYHAKYPLVLGNQQAEVYLTSAGKNDQKPLDLNPPSGIILLTFFKIRVKVTVQVLLSILKDLEVPKKIVIYEKQNLHALIELETTTGARRVKEALDGKMWKNMFLIRVQYTSKKNLSVNPNSPFEYEARADKQMPQEADYEDYGQEEAEEHQYFVGGYSSAYAQPVQQPYYPPHMNYQPYQQPYMPPYQPTPVMMPYLPQHSPGRQQADHVPMRPSPQAQTRSLPIPHTPSPKQIPQPRFAPVQMQPVQRQEVNTKELYYYTREHHIAPPTYPQMFQSPQIIAPYRTAPVKFTHDRPDERYLLQYCSPMMRPRPMHVPGQPQGSQRFKVVKIAGLRDNFRCELLLNLCLQFGQVVALKAIKKDRACECFVQFLTHVDANQAVQNMNKLEVQECTLDVSMAKYVNLQEIDIFEKAKTSLFMDLSADIEAIESPPPVRRPNPPSRFIEVLDCEPSRKKAVEQTLASEEPVSSKFMGTILLLEFEDLSKAVTCIAKHHLTQLSDGSKLKLRFSKHAARTSVGKSGSDKEAPECISEHNSDGIQSDGEAPGGKSGSKNPSPHMIPGKESKLQHAEKRK